MITAGRCTRSTPPVVVVKGASTASPGDAVAGTAPDSRRGTAPASRYRLRPFDLHGPRPSRDTPLGQLVSHLGQGRRSHRSCGTGLVGREGGGTDLAEEPGLVLIEDIDEHERRDHPLQPAISEADSACANLWDGGHDWADVVVRCTRADALDERSGTGCVSEEDRVRSGLEFVEVRDHL